MERLPHQSISVANPREDVSAQLHESIADRGPLHVVYLDHSAVLSGGELALTRLLPALDGVQPHVVLAQGGPLVERLRTAGISVEVLYMPSGARELRRDRVRAGGLPIGAAVVTAAYILRLAGRLRRLRPDLVHTNSLKSAIYGGLAGRLAGVPVVWHVRDRIAEDYLPTFAVRMVRALARRMPAGIVANSRSTLDALGPVSCPTAVVPGPIDPVLLDRPRPPRGDEPFTAVMVGRLSPWKGQRVFVEAFAQAFPGGPERAVVVGGALFGETGYERELHLLVARLGLTDRVEFTGHIDDVAGQLDRADVLVHASVIPEPFGLVVVEAMAAGVPVIAADAGGPAEVITNGVDGLLTPPGDVDALATAMQGLAADEHLRERLSANAHSRARDFGPDRIGPGLTDLYRAVVGIRSA